MNFVNGKLKSSVKYEILVRIYRMSFDDINPEYPVHPVRKMSLNDITYYNH